MQQSRHYTKASITEAVIDLQVEVPSEVTLSTLKNLQRSIELEYPVCEDMVTFQGQFQVGPSLAATASQSPIGYRFSGSDRKQIFQARLDGFTFSRLAPYERWESFRDEARRLWGIYQVAISPKTVKRVAVRYINRLDLPLPLNDFKDYLRTVPEVSPDLPQGLSSYFMQLQIPQEDLNGMLVLNEATLPPTEDVVSVLLDIDLFCQVNLPSVENAQWDLLEKLRVRKNQVFEACITDNTRRLLK